MGKVAQLNNATGNSATRQTSSSKFESRTGSFPWLAVAGCVFLILIDLVGFHTMYCLVVGIIFLAVVLILHFVRVSTSVKSVVLRMSSGDSVLVQSNKIAAACSITS